MTDDDLLAELADAYLRHHRSLRGPQGHQSSIGDHFWAWEQVEDLIRTGADPVTVVDRLLYVEGADPEFRAYVAAGPLEDLMTGRPDLIDHVGVRCRTDPVWAAAVAGVWVDRATWETLPPALGRLVPEPAADVAKARLKKKRPSKRQTRRPSRG